MRKIQTEVRPRRKNCADNKMQGRDVMSDNYKPRSLVEIMNDVLSAVRDYYDAEYVYYIEKEQDDIETIYEWCAENIPWQRDRLKLLSPEHQPKWMKQEITDTTSDSYSVFQKLDEDTTAILAVSRISPRRSHFRKCRSSKSI